jgi:outer membrane immunogenic protein
MQIPVKFHEIRVSPGPEMKNIIALASLSLLGCSIAQAADLPQAPPPQAPAVYVPVVPPFTWGGIYVGGNIGYGWSYADATDDGPAGFAFGGLPPAAVFPLGSSTSFSQKGFLGGAQLGFNYQISQLVLGLEGDFDATAIKNDQGGGFGAGSYTDPWTATLAARFGWAVDHALFYGKAGGAWMQEKYDISAPDGSAANGTFNRWGWMIGAGAEYAVTENITLKAEYNYLDFGSTDQTLSPNATDLATGSITFDKNSVKLTASVVKVGVNWLFH